MNEIYTEAFNSYVIEYISKQICDSCVNELQPISDKKRKSNDIIDGFIKEIEELSDEPTNADELIDTIMEDNTTNCLALTIKDDYKITSIVNIAIKSLRMSFKVFVSCTLLGIMKLFF